MTSWGDPPTPEGKKGKRRVSRRGHSKDVSELSGVQWQGRPGTNGLSKIKGSGTLNVLENSQAVSRLAEQSKERQIHAGSEMAKKVGELGQVLTSSIMGGLTRGEEKSFD